MSEEQKPTTDAYREGWQRIWGRQVSKSPLLAAPYGWGKMLCIECGLSPRQTPYLICRECLILGHRR